MKHVTRMSDLAKAGLALILASMVTACAESATGAASEAVAAVRVAPATTTVRVGDSARVQALVFDADGRQLTAVPVSWSSSDSTVAAVSSDGTVHVLAEGSAEIRASARGRTGHARVFVRRMPVATVILSSDALILEEGDQSQLSALTLGDSDVPLSGRTVEWSSSNTGVATVNQAGLVTAVKAGSAIVRATSEDKYDFTTVQVTESRQETVVSSVELAPATASIKAGDTTALSATLRDATGNVLTGLPITWTSSDSAVAHVSTSGVVVGLASGTATIRASSGSAIGAASVVVRAVLREVVLSPDNVSLTSGAEQLFSVSGRWSDGATTAPTVTYSASGGTITSAGRFTADITAGTYRVIAVQQGGSLADTATVTITVPPAPILRALILSPETVSLTSGATRQFSVSGQWSNGATTVPEVTYSATGGTISSAGLYTAGTAPGTYRVVARQNGGTLADTSFVALSPADGGVNPNEPSGYSRIADQPFNSLTADGWNIESSSPTLSSDATAPISPSGIVRATYGTGFGSGTAPWALDRPLASRPSSLYYRMAIKHSSNFQGQSSGTNKLGFAWIHDNPAFFLSAEGVGSGALVATARLQNTADSREYLRPNRGANGTLTRGNWHTLEVELTSNTAGVANGVVRVWLNGLLITEYTDVKFSASGQSTKWEALSIYPIWGGASGQHPTSTMTLDFDHIYISGR